MMAVSSVNQDRSIFRTKKYLNSYNTYRLPESENFFSQNKIKQSLYRTGQALRVPGV